jgi:hypothetical protein
VSFLERRGRAGRGILIATISVFVNFTFIPFEPWWALTIIFIDLWVIHPLFVHRRLRLRGGAEQAGFRTGPVGAWVYTYKRVLWIVLIAIAALVLVFWDQPTGRVIIGITLAVLVVLVIIEFLGRPPSPAASEPQEAESAGTTPEVSDAPPTASVAVASSQAHDTSEADVHS